jgi:hypothetical protein
MKRDIRSNAPSLPVVLKKLLCASAIGALGAFAPAHAGVVTFDNVQNIVSAQLNAGDTAYNTGDAFMSNNYRLVANNSATAESDEWGGVGALIDSDNVFACLIASCPVGADGTYYGGLNDGTLSIFNTTGSQTFKLKGLDFGFIGPVGGLPDFSYGRLILTGTTAGGATITTGADFAGQDNAGRFVFDLFGLDAAFASTTLSSLTISACLFDGSGDCISDRAFTQNQAQFGIDNLRLAEVPEPGSIALLLLGMAGLTATSRRRAK